ncbi:hypothetical protein DEO48_25605 [Enterobacter sp. CGMCC 5087]|nr:hypothetical protein DEO48_25605 [Enterobacter sp. CGMCC 5087]
MMPPVKDGHSPRGRIGTGSGYRSRAGYIMPAGIDLAGTPPMWVAVAWWGWLRGTPFRREDVELAFQVSARTANSVMVYLFRAHGEFLQCTRIDVPQPGRRPRFHLMVGAAPPVEQRHRAAVLAARRHRRRRSV